jgi:hypothetical protein
MPGSTLEVASLALVRSRWIRIIMRPGFERATVEKLSDIGFEFPSTNYKLVNGRPYRFAYGASDGPQARGAYSSAVVKVDLETGGSTSFSDDAHVFGELVFVSRPQGDGEDDGVLLTVGSAQDAESSVLAVINAKTMTLVASAEVASSIPLGFHGSFLRKEGEAMSKADREIFVNTGGRVLGFDFDAPGTAEHRGRGQGALGHHSESALSVLTDHVSPGDPIYYADGVVVAPDGVIHFTDGSTRFSPSQ